MAIVALNTIALGELVKVRISGVLQEFYVIHRGTVTGTETLITECKSFENATTLLAKNTQTDLMPQDIAGNSRSDLTSAAHYLDNDFSYSIDSGVRNSIIRVGIPVSDFSSSGGSSLFASYHHCWVLSTNELRNATSPPLGVRF